MGGAVTTGTPVTIVVSPRDWFSPSGECLDRLVECTPAPRRIVVVDGGSPPDVAAGLERRARSHDLALVRVDHFLTPNQARNLGAGYAATDWVAFLDNDLLVEPGWMDRLVACGEETGAAAVMPHVSIVRPDGQRPHFIGGDCGVRDDDGNPSLWEIHYLHDEPPAVEQTRRECGLFEFHLVLVRRSALLDVLPLDEELWSLLEHVDLALELRERGGSIWCEPAVNVAYLPPRSPRRADLDFFVVRWSDEWDARSGTRFADKWGLPSTDERLVVNVEYAAWLRNHAYLPYRSPMRLLAPWRRRVPRPLVDRLLQRRALARHRRRVAASGPPRLVHAPGWIESSCDA
jgi:GT2 family glycosyltransferase